MASTLLFLWNRLDKIVVVDIDGTITHTLSKVLSIVTHAHILNKLVVVDIGGTITHTLSKYILILPAAARTMSLRIGRMEAQSTLHSDFIQ